MREGLLPHTVTTVLKFATTPERARAVTELLGEVLDPTETAVSAFEIDDRDPQSPWFVEVFFADPPDEEAMRALIAPLVEGDWPAEAFTTVAARDWVAASLDGLKPVRAGRFLVHGAHDRTQARVNDIAIEIEAGLAFGTGHHGTTAGCLGALDRVLRQRRPRAVLDVGAGTGVLALAAARALRQRVVAGDIDPVAVEVARDNARLNKAGGLVTFYVGAGVNHAVARRGRHFDLVMANILARPLMRIARDLVRVLAPDGEMVLSGLLLADVPAVLAAYRLQGLSLRRRTAQDGWATLVLARGGAKPLTR